MARQTSVIGIYPDRTTVSEAINALHKAGYRTTDISVLSSDNHSSKDFAHEKHTRAPRGAAIGAAAGALIGAPLAWVVATQTFTVAGPSLAPLIAAGPVVATAAGAGVGGAVGWIVGLIAGMRQSEYVARRYAGRVRSGGILLSVHCDSPEWSSRAAKTLEDTGARNISSATEAAADFGTTDRPTERVTETTPHVVELVARPTTEPVHQETRE
jgi:hypothetical protein